MPATPLTDIAFVSVDLDGALAESPREQLQDDHDAQRALCAELEQIADLLPALPPPARVRRVCAQIECVTSSHFRRAEAILAELAAGSRSTMHAPMLWSLTEMHALDAVHGQDLVSVLWDSIARGTVERPGELGYMLRCFFDGCHRAIAFKDMLALLLDDGEGDRRR
jgi:hypothetical protein